MDIIIVLSASGTHQPTIFVLLGNYRTLKELSYCPGIFATRNL